MGLVAVNLFLRDRLASSLFTIETLCPVAESVGQGVHRHLEHLVEYGLKLMLGELEPKLQAHAATFPRQWFKMPASLQKLKWPLHQVHLYLAVDPMFIAGGKGGVHGSISQLDLGHNPIVFFTTYNPPFSAPPCRKTFYGQPNTAGI